MIGPLIFGALIAFGSGIGTLIIGAATIIMIIVYSVISSDNKAASKKERSLPPL